MAWGRLTGDRASRYLALAFLLATAVASFPFSGAFAQSDAPTKEEQSARVRLLTVQDNHKQPVVRALVEMHSPRDRWVSLGKTDTRGLLHIAQTCTRPFKLRVIPETSSFYVENTSGDLYRCAEAIVIVVRRLRIGMVQDQIPLVGISVVDERQRLIAARIEEVGKSGEVTHIADVTRGKIHFVRQSCTEGSQIRVIPEKTEKYFLPRTTSECASGITFVALQAETIPWLIEYGHREAAKGQFGTAALLFNESSERLRVINHVAAGEMEIQTLKAAGAYFGVSEDNSVTVDPTQGNKFVMDVKLKRAITGFQQKKNLNVDDGVLGYSTLRAMAGSDVYPYISKAYRALDRGEIAPAMGGLSP